MSRRITNDAATVTKVLPQELGQQPQSHALAKGCTLHWYEIDGVLGQGGFGITYLARDKNLGHKVAIKEFFPIEFAIRGDGDEARPRSTDDVRLFEWGLERFITEARTLAKFKHPNIVRVLSVFEGNGTAYMAMEYEEGESLEDALRAGRSRSEAELLGLTLPLLDALGQVHDVGIIHRDIKPENIYLRGDHTPVLLDFGSARETLGGERRGLTTLVSAGYTPFEQYNNSEPGGTQGPWTDIYALAATLYRAVSGAAPLDCLTRANVILEAKRDPLTPAVEAGEGSYTSPFLQAIDRGLSFKPGDRPQSVTEWKRLFEAHHGEIGVRDAPAKLPKSEIEHRRAAPTRRLETEPDPTTVMGRLADSFRVLSGNSGTMARLRARTSLVPKGVGIAVLVLLVLAMVLSGGNTYSEGAIADMTTAYLGEDAEGIEAVIERVFDERGAPNAYILGEEVGGAVFVGAHYGSGTLLLEDDGEAEVHWTTPVVGLDDSRRGAKVVMLVYGLPNPDAIFQKFFRAEGSSYAVGDAAIDNYQSGDIVVAPIRTRALIPSKARRGFLHFRRKKSWNPL